MISRGLLKYYSELVFPLKMLFGYVQIIEKPLIIGFGLKNMGRFLLNHYILFHNIKNKILVSLSKELSSLIIHIMKIVNLLIG